ncbi:MAG: hypothetical protein Q9180_003348 [Flavoplaca navasiana]
MGAQSFLHAAMEADLGRGDGGRYIKECKERDFLRKEVKNEGVAQKLWEFSDKQIESLEKEGAAKRAKAKKDDKEVNGQDTGKTAQQTSDTKNARTPGSRKSRKQ